MKKKFRDISMLGMLHPLFSFRVQFSRLSKQSARARVTMRANFLKFQDPFFDRLKITTGMNGPELIMLQYELGLSCIEMLAFHRCCGFLPTERDAIGIKHFGIDLIVMSVLNEQPVVPIYAGPIDRPIEYNSRKVT